jgi:predicted nuclease of predicted toxin-antitoxin system
MIIQNGNNEYKTFTHENTCGSVDVYTETEDYSKLFCRNQESPKINWSCCGSVSIEQAEQFCNLLKTAIKYAKKQKKKYCKGIV